MPNNRYIAGRNFEWARKKVWEKLGWHVIRASGSRGFYDLIAFQAHTLVYAIQCKKVQTEAQANRMLRAFEKNPPLPASKEFVQVMEVYVPRKGVFLTSVGGSLEGD